MLCVPISNRTNYSKLKPVLFALKDRVEIGIILSSSVLLEKYGDPFVDIENDGFNIIDKIDCLLENDTLGNMAKTAGLSMMEHAHVYERCSPEAILVVGDRFDMLPAVMAGSMMNIPIMHIQGGERSGSIDDTIRDMVSICATHHYVATRQSFERVKVVTQSDNIYMFGCPAVEYISSVDVGEVLDTTTFKKKYKTDLVDINPGEEYFLVAIHPDTTDTNLNMQNIMQAVMSFQKKVVVFYPNADAFNSLILSTLRKYKDKIILFKHAPVEDFTKLMAHTICMITNSSSGIREAASFGTPVVNVGNRQKFRERNDNTMNASYDKDSICRCISLLLKMKRFDCKNIYYTPQCTENIANSICKILRI